MPRKKMTIGEAKAELKSAKTEATAAKKDVTAMQKAFIDSPDKNAAAQYRAAVSDHIKAVQAMDNAENVLASLQEVA